MNTQIWRGFAISAAAVLPLILVASNVRAQSGADNDEVTLDEIIVSARKRDEAITDVPISITAFDAAKIEALGLEGIADLPAVTPGFVYEEFAGIPGRFDNSPRFRGISVNSLAPSRQTASVFVDGIFVSNGIQGIDLSDIERIEIIKGPQSAYFGRLTFGGAVNYITKTPSDEFAGNVNAIVAEDDEYGIAASIEGPMFGDSVAGRLSVSWSDKGGHFNAASSGIELGAEETQSVGGTLYITPNEQLEVKLRAFYYENDDGPPGYSFSGLNDHNCGPFGGPAADTTVCGDVPINAPDINIDQSDGLLTVLDTLTALHGSNRTEYGLDRESTRLSAQFDYSFANSNVVLSGLFGYNGEEVRLLRDADDTADNAYISYANREFDDSSQELRLSGSAMNDRLQWSIGANRFQQEFSSNGEFIVPALGYFAFGAGEPDLEDITTTGIFGSLEFELLENFRVTVEGRQQNDKVIDDSDITDTEPGVEVEFDNFLPRAIFEWTPNDDQLFYVSYAEGNLPGGYNGEVADLTADQLAELRQIQSGASPNFAEEKLDSYEFGWKQTLPEQRGTTTLSVFYMERTNQTFRRADNVTDLTEPTGFLQVDYFINAGESRSKGLEFDGEIRVTDMFTLGASVAYVDSEFAIFNSGVHNELFGFESAGDKKAERFPKWSGALSGTWAGELSGGTGWFTRADFFYQGERFADEGNLTRAASGSQLNLRAGINTDRYRAELFVKNVTDDDTPTAINRFRDLSFATPLFDFSTLGYQVGLRDPRQIGVRVSVDF